MLQQPPKYNFIITNTHNNSNNLTKATFKPILKVPSILIDFTAITLCDLIKIKRNSNCTRYLPELVYFVQKVSYQLDINVRTLLVALIYLQRAKTNLPKRAIGNDDTNHRMFLGAILTAAKYLNDTAWLNKPITNRNIYDICNGLFTLAEVNQLERAFLKLIQYNCLVDDETLNNFVELHRTDFSL